MASPTPQPESPDAAELVAYLDGELSAEAARRVERRLSSDADFRRQLTELEQAWNALDVLPATVAGDNFARTTIEMVAVAAEREGATTAASSSTSDRQHRYWLAAGGLAIALAAFAAGRWLLPNANRDLVADLPVIAQLDAFEQVGKIDVNFLRSLQTLRLPLPARRETTTASAPPAQQNSVDERRQWIEALPADQKSDLADKRARFIELSHAEQERLRALEWQMSTATDHDTLEKTLTAYAAWVQQLTPGKQLELREAATSDERLRLVEQTLAQSQRAGRRQLSLDDEKALQDAVLKLVEERRDEFEQEVARRNRNAADRMPKMSTAFVALAILGRELQDGQRRGALQDRLTADLSPETHDYLESLPTGRRAWQLWLWTRDALAPKLGPESLQKFFIDDLTNDQREYLLALPQAEMEAQLQQMYMATQVGLGGDELPRGFFRGWPGGGRGPWNGPPGDRDDRRVPRGEGGPRGEMGRGRFDGPPPFPGPGERRGRGPGGPPPGPPPGDREHWGPPPGDFGPPAGPPPPDERRSNDDQPPAPEPPTAVQSPPKTI